MMLVLLGTLCGYRGYRLLADFSHQHWQSLCELLELPKSATWLSQTEQGHVHRQVSVYAAPVGLHRHWQGLKHLIWVKRWGMRDGQSFEENIGYITNLEGSAAQFLQHIQQHWTIENRLRWVRDVCFEEDTACPGGNAPIIWAILNCFLITIIRQFAFRTIPQGVRALTNQLRQVYAILTQVFPSPK